MPTEAPSRIRVNARDLRALVTGIFAARGMREADAALVADAIKALPPADGVGEVLVPGERGRRCELDRMASGIPFGPRVWRELTALAAALGVPVPAVTG
jgi:LDH2 family malate/lactate/ureidoglycolate dehydrogenase